MCQYIMLGINNARKLDMYLKDNVKFPAGFNVIFLNFAFTEQSGSL